MVRVLIALRNMPGLDSPAEQIQMPATASSGPDSPALLIRVLVALSLMTLLAMRCYAGYSGNPAEMDGVVPGCGVFCLMYTPHCPCCVRSW